MLPSTTDLTDVSESALNNPLPWDVVPPKAYEPENRVLPYVDTLRTRSALRVKQNNDFAYLGGDVARLRRALASKSISLNEVDRRQELAQEKSRRAERERATVALAGSMPRTYEVTLESVDSPGLPSPKTRTGSEATLSPHAAGEDEAAEAAADDNIVLRESEHILADYIDLLGHPPDTGVLRRAAR